MGRQENFRWYVQCIILLITFCLTLFIAAIEMKWRMLQFFGKSNVLTDAYDSVIFGAIRDVTGGRLMYGISGGAPVSFETQKFITSSLCFMLQGYG